jgi:hypothetical protein
MINTKLRVALVRRTSLLKIGEMAKNGQEPDWEVVRTFHGNVPDVVLEYFQKRWVTLVNMHDQMKEMEGNPASYREHRRLFGAVDLTFGVHDLPQHDRGYLFEVVPDPKYPPPDLSDADTGATESGSSVIVGGPVAEVDSGVAVDSGAEAATTNDGSPSAVGPPIVLGSLTEVGSLTEAGSTAEVATTDDTAPTEVGSVTEVGSPDEGGTGAVDDDDNATIIGCASDYGDGRRVSDVTMDSFVSGAQVS